MIPSWILDIFAAIMLVVAAVSAARLVAARPWQRGARRAALADIDVAHLLMAIAMAGMLASGLRTLPDGAWEVVFAVMTAWFAYRVIRDAQVSGVRALAGGHCAPHLHPRRGHAVHVRRRVGARGARIGRHGRDGRRHERHGNPGTAVPGVPVRAGAGRVQHLGPGPALGPRHQRALQPRGRPRGADRPGAGRGRGDGRAGATAVPRGRRGGQPRPVAAGDGRGSAEVPPASAPADGTGVLAPWVATGCRIAMGITMAFMLVIMI